MDSGEGALLALKVARLEQQCVVLRQEAAVSTSEQRALTDCIGTMLRLVSGFVAEVKRELAGPHDGTTGASSSNNGAGDATNGNNNRGQRLSPPPPIVQEFVDAPMEQKAECAILATRHVEETLKNLFPFLLRCVRGSMSTDRSARSSPVNDAALQPSSSLDLPLDHQPAVFSSDEGNAASTRQPASTRSVVHGLLSDEHVRAILEHIEYDRRMKLLVKLFGELLHKLYGESTRALTAATVALQQRTAAFQSLSTTENLSPVTLSLDGSGRVDRRQLLLEPQQHDASSSPRGFTIPPPLQVHASQTDDAPRAAVGESAAADRHDQVQHGAHLYESAPQVPQQPFERSPNTPSPTSRHDYFRSSASTTRHRRDNPPRSRCDDNGRRFPSYADAVNNDGAIGEEDDDVVLPIATADTSLMEYSGDDDPRSTICGVHGGINHREESAAAVSDAVHEAVSSISSDDDDARVAHEHGDVVSGGSSVRSAPTRPIAFGFDVAEYRETVDTASLMEQDTLRIVRIRSGSAADVAGLVEGDRLEKVNAFCVSTHRDMEAVARVLRLEPVGTPVILTVVRRNRQRLRVALHMDAYVDPEQQQPRVQHVDTSSPSDVVTALHRTPVRRDLLGTYEISPMPAVRVSRSPHRDALRRHSGASDDSAVAALTVGVDPFEQHVVYHDGSMARRLNQTLERLKDIQRRREELQSAKSQLRGNRYNTSSAVTSRSGSPQSARSADISSSVDALVAFELSAQRTPRHLRASTPSSAYLNKRQTTPSPQRTAAATASPQRRPVSGSPIPSPRQPSPNTHQKSVWR